MAVRRSFMTTSRLFSTQVWPGVGSQTREAVNGSEVESRLDKRTSPEDTATHQSDPFSSVPLARLASYLGEKFAPKLEEIGATERQRQRPKQYIHVHEPPEIPHILPLTRWAAQSEEIRETLVVDDSEPRKVRLSWYHPDDTMIPRGWFLKGLLEDIKFYRPFLKKK